LRTWLLLALLAAGPARAADADTAALQHAAELIAAGSAGDAGNVLQPILADPKRLAAHPEAWARLGDLWAARDLPEAAVLAWAKAAEADPVALGSSLARAVAIAPEVGDEGALEPWLVRLPPDLAEPTRTRAAILGARSLIRSGQFAGALDLLGTVPKHHPDFARAQDLRGIALANEGEYAESLAALLTAEAAAKDAPVELRARITANLGRAYYGGGNYVQAIRYLDAIPHQSVTWQDHLVEHAWARFAIGDHGGTIAVLHTLQTPYFADWYTAEADLLRLQAYFLLCKLTSATDAADAFLAKYTPIAAALDASVPKLDGSGAWADAVTFSTGGTPTLPPAVLHTVVHQAWFTDTVIALAAIDAETATAEAAPEPWMRRAVPLLRARRTALVTAGGERVLGRAKKARTELASLLQDVPVVKLDVLQLQTEVYSKAAATGKLDYGDRIGRLRKLRKTPGTRTWPVDDREVWADELGYYRVDIRSDCPQEPPQ